MAARWSAQEAVDGGLEIDDRAEDAALEATAGQFGEEAFDRLESGARGWGAVEHEPRMAAEPGADLGVLMSTVIVEDHMDDLAGRHLGLDRLRKRMNSWCRWRCSGR